MSEETKQKIKDAFAAKRLAKESQPKIERTEKKTCNVVCIKEDDKEALIDMGKSIQDGEFKRLGYCTEGFMFGKL